MKKNFSILFLLVLSGCQYPNSKTTLNIKEKDVGSSFFYDASSTKIMWTAYKFSEKVGVSGFLDSIVVENTILSRDPLSVFENASFLIYANSVNSANEIRDKKIADSFFGKMINPLIISGKMKSINIDTSLLVLKMNGVEREVPVLLNSKGTNVSLRGEININDWYASPALSSLNSVCELEHSGKNGSSVLWPNITILITTTLQKSK